jgi:hypothetical protein
VKEKVHIRKKQLEQFQYVVFTAVILSRVGEWMQGEGKEEGGIRQ